MAHILAIDLFSINNLVWALVVLVAVVLILAFRSQARQPAVRVQVDPPAAPSPSRNYIGEIVRTRVAEGVAKSLNAAAAIDAELVQSIAAAADSSPGDRSPELAHLQAGRDFIGKYRRLHADPVKLLQQDQLELLSLLRDAAASSDPALMRFYDFLLKFERDANKELPQIIDTFQAVGSSFDGLGSRDRQFKATIEVVRDVSGIVTKHAKTLEVDRPLALEHLKRVFLNAYQKLESADGDASRGAGVPEFQLLRYRWSDVVQVIRKEADAGATRQFPSFAVSMTRGEGPIEVKNTSLTLNFRIEDMAKIRDLREITIMPRSKSNDLIYSGEVRHRLLLENHQLLVPFTFDVDIFDQTDYDQRPVITFDITYILYGEHQRQEVEFRLPTLIPKPQVVNPFEDGKRGTGLEGTSTLFVGRKALMTDLATHLLAPKPAFYWVHGLARTGKSSVLNQLADNPRWLKERYTPIIVNAQGSQQPFAFFYHFYHILRDKLATLLGSVKGPDEAFVQKRLSPFWRPITDLLRENKEALKARNHRILFLVDEFQSLATWDIDARAERDVDTVWYQFPEFVKVLRDLHDSVAAVVMFGLYSLKDMDRIRHHWTQQLGGRVEEQQITNLDQAEADELIERQFQKQQCSVPAAMLARIRSYTGCHAFLQMLMGYYIFQILTEGGTFRHDRQVTVADVDRAAMLIPSVDLKFVWADPWIAERPTVRLFLAALAQKSFRYGREHHDATSLGWYSIDDIRSHVRALYGIEFTETVMNFETVIGDFYAQNVIIKNSNGMFSLRYPLFALAADSDHLLEQFLEQYKAKAGSGQ